MTIKQYTKEEIGAIFFRLRKCARLTQAEVAERLHTTAQTISRWEKGENQPDLNTFFHLCAIYECDISLEFGLREATNTIGRHLEDPRVDEISVKFYELTPTAKQRVYESFVDTYQNEDNRETSEWLPAGNNAG